MSARSRPEHGHTVFLQPSESRVIAEGESGPRPEHSYSITLPLFGRKYSRSFLGVSPLPKISLPAAVVKNSVFLLSRFNLTDPSLFPGIKSKQDTRKQNNEITLFPKTNLLCPLKRAISVPFQYVKRLCVYLRRRLRKSFIENAEIKINCLFFVCFFPHIKPQKETSRD